LYFFIRHAEFRAIPAFFFQLPGGGAGNKKCGNTEDDDKDPEALHFTGIKFRRQKY
jgi:hypothetical protein